MIESVLLDAEDIPLGATERAAAVSFPRVVLRGLGTAGLQHPHARLRVRASGAAERALRAEAKALQADLVWDSSVGDESVRLRPSELVEAEWRANAKEQRLVTVAGAVKRSHVVAARNESTVRELVGAAQPVGVTWVALYGGVALDRDQRIADAIAHRPLAPRLLLVLPARHALVRRAKAPLSTWLQRAQSACAACSMCEPRCAVGIPIARLLRTLSMGGVVRPATQVVASAAACTSCGACDLACPSSLAPSRIVGDLGERARVGGIVPSPRAQAVGALDRALWLARQGLARYDREPSLDVSLAT